MLRPVLTLATLCLTALATRAQQAAPTTFAPHCDQPLVTNMSAPTTPTQGLSGRHIAVWHSHGRYYERTLDRWEWQRARLLQTVEDLYTQSYVLPFLVPMLENAGANVLVPRERDWNTHEVVVDNDASTLSPHTIYKERNGQQAWQQGQGEGFAYRHKVYTDFQNPFRDGTFRTIQSIKKGQESLAEWVPNVPKTGEYAVYISYKTVPGSTATAHYTVYHQGGESHFRVNQQMGGGTWIYLGKFVFDEKAGQQHRVCLSNNTGKVGEVVTADGVKFGGGMGNVGRPDVSGYPRFTEAARYWLQWAGVPDSVYSESHGENDYTDDYKSRGMWVNWLAGGSQSYPEGQGLNVPIDLSLAFHSDAGVTKDDRTIGTLGIYYTQSYDSVFANGASRYLCKDLTESVQNSILNDIRALYEPLWNSRGSRDASYFEARTPRVPAMLLELLSHQNFADMRYGLDPRFRFTVSRAIYKGMLRFICAQRGQTPIVAPLPVDHLSASLKGRDQVELTWNAVADTLEPSAMPDRYIVYTRLGNGAFDNGKVVKRNRYVARIPADVVCSFRVEAVNKGGKSFPSETMAVARCSASMGKKALVVNGFDRVCAPADFVAPAPIDTLYAGFLDNIDHGVPYLQDISYTGSQKEFNRTLPWLDDDSGGYGDSYGNEETKVIAGNTFDYPALHGEAILKAGLSFESCANECLDKAEDGYVFVDYILGKQCQTKMGRGNVRPLMFKTFDAKVQKALAEYAQRGVHLFVSGAYVGSDLWCNPLAKPLESDQRFATEVLKYKWRNSRAALTGGVRMVRSPLELGVGEMNYANTLNAEQYIVESPDAIEAADSTGYTVMRYPENNLSAAVASQGSYKTFVMGFPFESITQAFSREKLMKTIVDFFMRQPHEDISHDPKGDGKKARHITSFTGEEKKVKK